jgi:hypothetical protein
LTICLMSIILVCRHSTVSRGHEGQSIPGGHAYNEVLLYVKGGLTEVSVSSLRWTLLRPSRSVLALYLLLPVSRQPTTDARLYHWAG